jgi:hypothetical protein
MDVKQSLCLIGIGVLLMIFFQFFFEPICEYFGRNRKRVTQKYYIPQEHLILFLEYYAARRINISMRYRLWKYIFKIFERYQIDERKQWVIEFDTIFRPYIVECNCNSFNLEYEVYKENNFLSL